jgi:membrane associated rhomboid family serine protease
MFPYHDENQTQRTPYVTLVLIAINVAAWLLVQGAGAELPLARSVCELGLIPGELTASLSPGTRFPMGEGLVCLTDPGRQVENVVASMFLHGSWMHLLGNTWFLWLFGNNIEDSMTRPRFLAFYLLAGLAAALAQVFADPASPVPMVGASGAISGVMGAYLVLFPRVRVFTLLPLGFYVTSIRHLDRPAGVGDASLLGVPAVLRRDHEHRRRARGRRRFLGTPRGIPRGGRPGQALRALRAARRSSVAPLAAAPRGMALTPKPFIGRLASLNGRLPEGFTSPLSAPNATDHEVPLPQTIAKYPR